LIKDLASAEILLQSFQADIQVNFFLPSGFILNFVIG